MCKNADKPCPGCPRHKVDEVPWRFFTEDERRAIEARAVLPPAVQPPCILS